MEIFLALFIFGQIPITYADTTWTMYGGNLENTHFQKMMGAMQFEPYVKWSYLTGKDVEACGAVVADVDGDGNMEVVFGNYDHKVYCLDGITGGVEWSYPTGAQIYSSPIIADVDGDGDIEIVAGSMDTKVYCLNGATGIVEWSYQTGDWIYSSPAIADVDGDGDIEIIIGSEDAKVYCLDGITGGVEWSYLTGDMIHSCPAIADVDVDGNMEVVFGSLDNKVYCLDGITGGIEWSYPTRHGVYSSPAIADINLDGNIEVIIGSHDSTAYCLNGIDGTVKWSYPTSSKIHRGISIADIDGYLSGELKLEVLLPSARTDSLVCLNGEDGSILWVKKLAFDIHDVIIADIDNDGCVELIIGTQGDSTIWALDDVHSTNIEENRKPNTNNLEFKAMGKGIYLFTPNAIQVDINVYDVSGRLEQTIYKGILSKGRHTFMPKIKSSGIYFAVLKSSNFNKRIKLTNIAD